MVQVTRKELSDPSHRSDLVCFVLAQSYALYIYFSTVGRFTRILFFFFLSFLYSRGFRGARKAGMMVLFWNIIHSSHNVVRLPPGMLDKPNKVQRVQRAYEPRLHVHLPLFFLLLVPVTVALPPINRCQVTPLALDDL